MLEDIVSRLRIDMPNCLIELEAADEIDRLRRAIECALKCTPHIMHGTKIIYDCGNPWETLSNALKGVE